MARQVLPLVGAVIGGIYGGPAGAQAGAMIGSLIGNAVDPEIIKGPSIGDGQQTVSAEGTPRPIIYGTGAVGGNIIAKGDLIKKKKRKRQSKGGPIQETEHFYMTYAIRICEGPITGLLRVWEDEKLSYDVRLTGSLVSAEENNKYASNFKVYLGGEDQLPDPDLEVVFGVGDTPAFRGTAYLVFPNRDLTERQGSVPNYRFEVTTASNIEEEVGTNLISLSHEFSLASDEITHKSYNINISTTDFPTNYSFNSDAQFLAWKEGTYGTVKCLKYNSVTQKFDIDIPFESGDIPSPPPYDDYPFGTCYSTPGFHPNANILFLNANGYICVYQIENDLLVFKSIVPAYLPGSPSGSFYISEFLFNETGTKVVAMCEGSSKIFTYNFDKNTYTLNNMGITTYSPGMSDYGKTSAFKQNRLVKRHNDTLRIWELNTLTNIFEVKGIKTDLHNNSPTANNVVFLNNNATRVYTVTNDTDTESEILTCWSIIPSLGPYALEFVESETIEQPETGVFSSNQNLFDFNGKYLVCPANDTGPTVSDFKRITLYKYDDLDDEAKTLYLIQEFSYPKNADGAINIHHELLLSKVVSQNLFDGGPWQVKDIIADIADRLKINVSKINVADIDDLSCDGLIVAQQYTGGNVIRKLQEIFFFDASEYDKKLNFIKRGKPAIKAITFEECVAESYEAERKNAIEYPRKIELMYQNARIGYVGAKAVAERISPDFAVSGTQTFESPIVLNEDKAAQAVDKMHKVSWADAEGNVKFSLPTEFQDLVVADCIAFYMRDTVQRLRIETIETADGVMNVTARVDRQSAYSSVVTGLPLPDPTAPPGTITGVTIWAYLDIPALVDNNDALLYYYAGTGATDAWHGYVMQRSELEADFEDVGSSNSAEGIGYLTTPISNASEHYVDATNEIFVQMYNDVYDFESITDTQLLNEKNAIAICRADGSAEIIQYRDAEYLENNLWKLSYLIRGRLNSKTSAHSISDQVVILDTVNAEPVNSPLLNKVLEHRAVSYDSSAEDAEIRSYEFIGRSQTEWPVDFLTATDDGTNISVSWSPRERFGTDVAPVRSVNWQNYEIEISDGITTQTLFSLLPTAQFLTADFVGTVDIKVWQINRFTGRGEVAITTITL